MFYFFLYFLLIFVVIAFNLGDIVNPWKFEMNINYEDSTENAIKSQKEQWQVETMEFNGFNTKIHNTTIECCNKKQKQKRQRRNICS